MNKKLIALAVAAAIAPAAAMADSGNVSIYGVLDASYDLTKIGDGTTTRSGATATTGASANKVSNNNSRLGFKGTEDVGNGLSAVWQIETALNVDGGSAATTLGSRNTYVGLSSKTAGTVLLGRHDTPYKLATRGLDLFGDGLADNRNIMGGGGTSTAGSGALAGTGTGVTTSAANKGIGSVASFDGRQSDVVAYISPTISGMHAAVAYVAGAEDTNTSGLDKGNAWSLAGLYDNGPLFASLAYERHNLGSATTGTLAGAGNSESEKAWKLGLGYTLDALKLGFAYEKTSDDLGKTGGVNCNTGSTSNDCAGHKAWTLSAGYTMGSNMLKAAYTRAGNLGDATNTGAHQWALGVDHNMSKRTKVYAQYVKLNNDSGAAYALNGAGSGATGSVATPAGNTSFGQDPSAWQFGMRHSF